MRVLVPAWRGDSLVRLSELSRLHLEHILGFKGFSRRTAESYDLSARQFVAWLLAHGYQDDTRCFDAENVSGFARDAAALGLKANSVLTKLAGLSALGKFGTKASAGARGKFILAENPVVHVEKPQMQRPERKFLHRDELAALLAVDAPEHERLSLDLFVSTGLRVSELVNATVADLWLDGERLVLAVSVKGRGRRAEKVPIALDPALGARLLESLTARGAKPDEPLLVNREGGRYSRTSLSGMVARLGRRAGITRFVVRPHSIRHSFNIVARQAGLDAFTRSRLLNHSDANTVQRYDHLDGAELADAREKVHASLRRLREERPAPPKEGA